MFMLARIVCETINANGIPIELWVQILLSFAVALIFTGLALMLFYFVQKRNNKFIRPK
jgi:hypothetical protein